MTYRKTLVTGKPKTAIAEFAYCGAMYKDALRTLERKFGQSQAVLSAHLTNSELSTIEDAQLRQPHYFFRVHFKSFRGLQIALIRLGFKECRASQHRRTEASTQYEGVVVTLNGQKALDETYSSTFNDWLKEKAEAI